jgi:hypothetical protein
MRALPRPATRLVIDLALVRKNPQNVHGNSPLRNCNPFLVARLTLIQKRPLVDETATQWRVLCITDNSEEVRQSVVAHAGFGMSLCRPVSNWNDRKQVNHAIDHA